MARSSEGILQEQQAELISELERTWWSDAAVSVVVAGLATALLSFMFGRPCLRGEAFLGHVWCAEVGPWSYTRLGLFALLNLGATTPLTFSALRGRRRRRFWSF